MSTSLTFIIREDCPDQLGLTSIIWRQTLWFTEKLLFGNTKKIHVGNIKKILWKHQYFATQPMQLSIMAGLEFWPCLGPIRGNSNQGFVQNLNVQIFLQTKTIMFARFKKDRFFLVWSSSHCLYPCHIFSSIPQYLQGRLKIATFVAQQLKLTNFLWLCTSFE